MADCGCSGVCGVAALLLLLSTAAHSQSSSVCYGDSFIVPHHWAPQQVFYAPRTGPRRLVLDRGKSLDPLFTFESYPRRGWTNEDEGTVSVPALDQTISVSVIECKAPRRRRYGDSISLLLMSGTQYLQFVPSGPWEPAVLWNQSAPEAGRGTVRGHRFDMSLLTQRDSGYYNFRGARHELLTWTRLEVTYHVKNLSVQAGDELHCRFPFVFSEWQASRLPQQHPNHLQDLGSRVVLSDDLLHIVHVEPSDAGTYEFVDRDHNVMLQIHLTVTHKASQPGVVFGTKVLPVLLLVISCCGCLRKCSRTKKKSSDDNPSEPDPEPAPDTATAPPAAPAVYYHPPPSETVMKGPTTAPDAALVDSPEPPSYSAGVADVIPPPQVCGGVGSLSASAQPQFNISGVTFPSAPPLATDTFTSDTYTSDKFNFL